MPSAPSARPSPEAVAAFAAITLKRRSTFDVLPAHFLIDSSKDSTQTSASTSSLPSPESAPSSPTDPSASTSASATPAMTGVVLPSTPHHFHPQNTHHHSALSAQQMKDGRAPPSVPLHTRPKFPKLPQPALPSSPIHRRVHSSSIVNSVSSASSGSPYSPIGSPLHTPKFHLNTDDGSTSPAGGSPQSPNAHWSIHSPTAAAGSPKPPSPPLNHTNTFHRANAHLPLNHDQQGGVRPMGGALAPPPLLSSVQPTKRAVALPAVAVQSEERSGTEKESSSRRKDSKAHRGQRKHRVKTSGSSSGSSSGSGSSSTPPSTPSPPPPSPSSSTAKSSATPTRVSPTATTRSSAASQPSASSLPQLGSPIPRTTSLPVVPHKQPMRAPLTPSISSSPVEFVPPAAMAPAAVMFLHASYVQVRTGASLLNRWQKKWLTLSQSAAPSTSYRLLVYNKQGDTSPVDAYTVLPTSSIIPSDPDRKPCRLKVQVTPERVLSMDALTPADRTQWLLAVQQAVLLTQHEASMSAPASTRPLTFPPPAEASASSPQSLTAFQLYFFHLYYNLPEVGYVHAQYDHAMESFKKKFITEEAILLSCLKHVPDEDRERRGMGADGKGEDDEKTSSASHLALNVNEAAISTWLTTKFQSTALPAILLQHTLATSTKDGTLQAVHSLLHPTSNAHVMVDQVSQVQLLVSPGAQLPTSPTTGLAKQRFEQRFHSPATFHHLCLLLFSPQPALAAMAFRLLWLLLANVYPAPVCCAVFSAFLTLASPAVQGSEEMIATMRTLLFSPSLHLPPGMVGLRTPFLRPYALVPLLTALQHATFALCESVLKDVSSCLLNPSNVAAIASLPQWQSLLFGLLTQVHYVIVQDIGGMGKRESGGLDDGEEVEYDVGGVVQAKLMWHVDVTTRGDYKEQRSVYSFIHNIFAVVHYRTFLTSRAFVPLLSSTLDQLFTFGGPRVATQRTAVLVLHTLLSLIEKNVAKRAILTSADTQSVEWKNLAGLLSVIKVYLFLCHHWVATDTDAHTYLVPAASVRMALYQCRFRHPAFVPFAHLIATSASSAGDTVGVHFDEDGVAVDAPLVTRLLAIMQALSLDQPPTDAYREVDRVALQALYTQWLLFDSSAEFLHGLQERRQSKDSMPIRSMKEAVVQFIDDEAKRAKDVTKGRRRKARDASAASYAGRSRADSRSTESSSVALPSPFTTPTKRSTVRGDSESESGSPAHAITPSHKSPVKSTASSPVRTPAKATRPMLPPALKTPIRRQVSDVSTRPAPGQGAAGEPRAHVSLTRPPPSPDSPDSPIKISATVVDAKRSESSVERLGTLADNEAVKRLDMGSVADSTESTEKSQGSDDRASSRSRSRGALQDGDSLHMALGTETE